MKSKKLFLIPITVTAVAAAAAIASNASVLSGVFAQECDHSHVEHHDAVAATYNGNGHIEYWTCCQCHVSFADAALQNPISDTEGSDPTASTDGRHTDRLTYKVTSPLEYAVSSVPDGVTAPDGFETVNAYEGTGAIGGKYVYLDLSQFKEISWAVRAADANNKWYEAFKANGDSSALLSHGGSTDWRVFKFVNEGNGYFQGYKNGSWANIQLPLDYNLGQMYVKMTDDAIFYHTEIRCVAKDTAFESGVSKIYDWVADSLWGGTTAEGESFDWAYNNSVEVIDKTTHYSTYALQSFTAADYTDFMFGIKATVSGAWTYISAGGNQTSEMECPQAWTTAWLHKESDSTWTLRWYRAYISGISITNLNEVSLKVADASYQVTALYGIAA